jgi:hypothetical protein
MNEITATIPVQEESTAAAVKAYPAKAYWAQSATSGLAPGSIRRRAPRPQDVQLEIFTAAYATLICIR